MMDKMKVGVLSSFIWSSAVPSKSARPMMVFAQRVCEFFRRIYAVLHNIENLGT